MKNEKVKINNYYSDNQNFAKKSYSIRKSLIIRLLVVIYCLSYLK